MSDCICNSTLPSRLLRGVTRTVKITVVDKNDDSVDLTIAREVTVRVSMDGRPWSEAYVPGISISGEGNNIVTFTWYADVQRCGRYTIDLNADFGNRNQSRVDFHREFGVELVEHSNEVSVTPSETLEVDDELDLEGTLEVTTDGMSAFDQWRTSPESEGYPPTEEGFFDWIRQPATDAATAAATQMGQIQDRADEDHRLAAADHTTAGNDHTTAASDHGIAANDHTQAGNDHTQAASDHTRAGEDHTQAGQDHTQAGNDHTTAAADHTIAGQDHTQAGQDHTQAGNDHTRAEGDHTQAGNDHTRAESDHTRAEQDHTRAEQDHASVGEAVKYTQQTLTDEQKTQARTNIGAGTYSKPANGIPASDMANDSMFVRGNNTIWQGTSITSAGTAAKTASISGFTASDLAEGVMVVVTFSNTNTAAPNLLTLNIAARGAKPIKRWVNGGLADIDKPESLTGTMAFIYDGTNWVTWYESFDDVDGNCLDAKFGNVTLHQWKPDYTMTDGSYVKGADGLLYEYSGSKYVEIEVGDAERVRFLGIYPKYSSWTNGFAFGKYENDQWVTIESEKFDYDTSQDASITKEYIRAVPSGATHFRTSSATSSLLWLERNFYLYLQTGKPAVSQEELEDAVNPTIGTTQPAGGFLPNKVYDLGVLTGTVTFALAAPTDNTRPNPYHWTFDTGSTAPTVAWPANITWPTDFEPTVNANCHYEVLIRNDYATLLEFSLE